VPARGSFGTSLHENGVSSTGASLPARDSDTWFMIIGDTEPRMTGSK
jgi:hypothetical protein